MAQRILGDRKKRMYDENLVDIVNKKFEQPTSKEVVVSADNSKTKLLQHFVDYLNSLDVAKYLEPGTEHKFLLSGGSVALSRIIKYPVWNHMGLNNVDEKVNNSAVYISHDKKSFRITPIYNNLEVFCKQYVEKFSEEWKKHSFNITA